MRPRPDGGRREGTYVQAMTRAAALLVIVVAAASAAAGPAGAAVRKDRVIWWSGYRWTVRADAQPSPPGDNVWGDSRAHVRKLRDGRLRLNMVGLTSTELIGPRAGYGRYRWVLDSDMSKISPFRVVALDVQGTRGELDVEFSRWGVPMPEQGSWVAWQNGQRLDYGLFGVTPRAPYVIVIDWRRGKTKFSVRDRTGKSLLVKTTRSPVAGRFVSARIAYWHFHAQYATPSPFTTSTRHPPVIVRSFRFTPLAGRST